MIHFAILCKKIFNLSKKKKLHHLLGTRKPLSQFYPNFWDSPWEIFRSYMEQRQPPSNMHMAAIT
jgi:hypothetical protein